MTSAVTRRRLLLAVIVLAGVVLRFWNLAAPRLTADERLHYFPEMQHIHELSFAEQRRHPTYGYHAVPPNPVGHPALAIQIVNVALRALTPTPEVARGVMALCGSVLIVVAFVLGRDLYSWHHGLTAAAIAALLPLAVRYQRTLYLDPVYSLLTAGFVWCLFRALSSPTPPWVGGAAVLLGLSAATKISAVFLVPFTVAYGGFVCLPRVRCTGAAPWAPKSARSVLIAMTWVLAFASLTFVVLVSPGSFVASIRNPADTAYRDRTLTFYVAHLWSRRAWLAGVVLHLWTVPVLLAAIAGLAAVARRWRQARSSDALVVLWLVASTPLLFLHVAGLSGEHGYLSFVLPGALLAAIGLESVAGRWRALAWVAILAAMIPAAILYGHRLVPVPYDSYLNTVDR